MPLFRPATINGLADAVEKHCALQGDAHQSYLEMSRLSAMIDQKATSMLTFLALLLGGSSIFVATSQASAMSDMERIVTGLAVLLLYGMLFAAAFLCFSVTRLMSPKRAMREADDDGQFSAQPQLISWRYHRFIWAFWLTASASIILAILVVVRVAAEYFL